MLRIRSGAAILICALAIPAGRAQAQTPLRILAGPTLSNVSTDEWETSSKLGFFAAVGTSFALSESVFVSPFLGYVQKGTTFDDDDSDGSYNYIEIPVLLGTEIPVGEKASLSISAGPQVAFNIKCDEDGVDCSDHEDFKSTEFGIVAGVGIGFPLTDPYNLSFGLSYDLGLTDVFEEDEGGFKNRVIYLWGSIGTAIGG